MNAALHIPVRQGSDEWLEYRRASISATDLPVLLGLSPYKCEADLADEKRGLVTTEQNLPMKVGLALEDVIAGEYEAASGKKLQRFRSLMRHREIEWAVASPDRRVIGERKVVELKYTGSASRFADGLPQDIEAQCAWQLGVLGWDSADVAVLVNGREFRVFPVEPNPGLFDDLVVVASDFRRRLADGGPFGRDLNRIRRDHPADDGTELVADAPLVEAAHALVLTRQQIASLETLEEQLKTAIQDRMGAASVLVGPDFRATWRKSKDTEATDWKSLATSLLTLVPETDRSAVVGLHSSVRSGVRPFRLQMGDPE